MAIRSFLVALALLAAAPAFADTTGVYATSDGNMTMTVEVASNGDVRGTMGGKLLDALARQAPEARPPGFITRDGEGYFIQPAADGVSVIRASDAAAVMAESFREHASGIPASPMQKLVARGTATVNGRTGTAYASGKARAGEPPSLVISADPDLSELARAMAGQFEMSVSMGQALGFGEMGGDMLALLRTGVPLRFAGMELTRVTHDAIAPDRFELPAPPLSREAIRALMVHQRAAPPKPAKGDAP
jgi:hypothetical protein